MLVDPTRKLTERYDREAEAYRELWAPVLRIAAHGLVRHLVGAPARRILDVGTGVGSLLPALETAFPGASVLGVDRSRGMLAFAPAGFPRAVMDARRLAIRSGSVDLAVFAFVLFHLEQPEDGLREARRVLRSGGRLGTLTWGGDMDSRATRVWTECLDAHGAAPADPAAAARHETVDTPEKMQGLLSAAGFPSARAWTEELVATIDLEHLIGLRTRLGSSRPRFESLAPAAREACVADARRRMGALAPADFTARGSVVYAVADAGPREAGTGRA